MREIEERYLVPVILFFFLTTITATTVLLSVLAVPLTLITNSRFNDTLPLVEERHQQQKHDRTQAVCV